MKVLILRKVNEDMTSHEGNFTYPKTGYVEAPDWDGKPECGGGLHGLLWGQGSFDLDNYGTLFQVIEADSENVIEFGGKCKFKCGDVLLTGSQQEAVTLIKSHSNYPKDNVLNYDIQIDVKFAVGGYRSTLTGGDRSVLIVYACNAQCNYVPFVKKITKATANKSFKFENGKFNLVTK